MTDFDDLLEVESLISALEVRREELLKNADSKDLIRARVQGIFDRFPLVTSLGWVQYVPYFNDGDPCTWTIYGPGINPKTFEDYEAEGLEDEWYGGSEEMDTWALEAAFVKNPGTTDAYYVSKRAEYPGFTSEIVVDLLAALQPVKDWLENSAKYLDKLFGHATVVVKRDGTVSVSEYEHD
jgi:hypothetical protein